MNPHNWPEMQNCARFNGDESGKGALMIFSQRNRIAFSWLLRGGIIFFGLLCIALPGKAQAREAFRADRMDTVLYGVAYYPEYMPYDRLDPDVQLM